MAMPSQDRLAAMRSAAQSLGRSSAKRSPADLAAAVAGFQAQEPPAARLSFRARDKRLTAADVDHARNVERSLLRTWVMRDTMHLLAIEDAAWMLPLFEPRLERKSRARLGTLGMNDRDVERGLAAIREGLGDGPVRRPVLAEAVEAAGVELNDQTSRNLFHQATVAGICCQGPDDGGQQTLIDRREWLDQPPAFDRYAAIRELTLRYIRAFGPANEADFAGWSSLGLGDVRAGFASIAGHLVEVELHSGSGWKLRGRAAPLKPDVVRLLPAYDTYLMGHRDRDFIAPGPLWKKVLPGGGILRPTILVGGAAVGTWKIRRTPKRIEVRIEPFAPLTDKVTAAIEAEVADIGRFEAREARLAD
ncbi:winged helix DNA-binding domain-containing protein [soil metagenome]